MPKGYTRHTNSTDSGYDSGYESDEGTKYNYVKKFSSGSRAHARLFRSILKPYKDVVVLNPTENGNIEEAIIKQRFFSRLYTDKQAHLFEFKGTKTPDDYRLIVPYIPYTLYIKLKDELGDEVTTIDFKKTVFKSAIRALKACHQKGLIVIDLKDDGIFYDRKMQISYLIDGGLSVPIGTSINSNPKVISFQRSTQAEIEQCKTDYNHIAPECWSLYGCDVVATPAMDTFSLGRMMEIMMDENPNPDPTLDSEIKALIDACLKENPNDRPTLEALEQSLDELGTRPTTRAKF